MLETSDYLKDDCLKINCTVGVVVSAIDCSRLHLIQVPDSDIGSDFGMLLENMEGSDVVFNVAGEKFHAHKLVLTARSPIFRSEFFDASDSDKQEIIISDMEPKVFKVSVHAFTLMRRNLYPLRFQYLLFLIKLNIFTILCSYFILKLLCV